MLVAKLLRPDASPEIRSGLLLRRARARLAGQHPDSALEDIQAARALFTETASQPEVLELMADAYFSRFELAPFGFTDRSDADQAVNLYRELIRKHLGYSNLGWVLYQMGRALLTENEIEEAIECFREALLQPSHVTALTAFCYERLGFVYLFDQRDPATALTFLDKASVSYPTSEPEVWLGHLHILRSKALREQGKHDEALTAATNALRIMENLGTEMRSGQQDAHLALGEIMIGIPGRESAAISHLQHFLQLGKKPLGVDVTWSRVNEQLGDLLFQIEAYDGAIDAYSASLAFNPYHPWGSSIYYQLARSHYRLRAYEKKIATIQEMARAASEDAQIISDYRVFQLLGNAFFALEQFDAAASAYRKAVEFAPDDAVDLEKIQTYLRFAQELGSA